MSETWKDIKGYEGYYQVSTLGNIKSLQRVIIRNFKNHTSRLPVKEILMKPILSDASGYYRVSLSRKILSIHRLVAIAFLPNPENKPTVNHKDGNKLNNHVDNLEWATCSEQTLHAFKMGLINQDFGRNPNAQRIKDENGIIYSSITELWVKRHANLKYKTFCSKISNNNFPYIKL